MWKQDHQMDTSDSDDEEGNSAAPPRSQADRLAREEAFFRFVNNLSEEDYKLMRDNNLLGIVGDYTEEELLRKLQHVKENPPQESDRRGSSDVLSDDSMLGGLAFFDQTENMTEREQRLNNQPLPSTSNSNSSDFSVGMNSTPNSGRQNQGNEHLSFARPLQREDMENRQRQVENPMPESTMTEPSRSEGSASETLLEDPLTRSHRRTRSRSPEFRRVRARTGNISHSHSLNEMLLRFHYSIAPETFEFIEVNEANVYSRVNQRETPREQITRPDLEITVHSEGYSLNYPEELLSRISYFQPAGIGSSVSTTTIPIHIVSNTGLNDIASIETRRTLGQMMSMSDELYNVIDSESDLEISGLPTSQNMERVESPNTRDDSDNSSISVHYLNPATASRSVSSAISTSNSHNTYSLSSSSMSSASSENENADISSLTFESNNERSASSSSSSEPMQERQHITSVIFDENDPWPFLAHFFPLYEEVNNQPTGLTKQQIDNLAIRIFGRNDAIKACSICITEFTEGCKIRILPCSHEYHVHCIDRWLAESTTCPICRKELTDSNDSENSN